MILSTCIRSLVILAIPSIWLAAELNAAEPLATLQVSGSSEVETQPKLIRLNLQISSQGKDFKEAMEKLTQQQDLAKAEIIKLGAIENSVKLTPPNFGTGATDEQRRMEMMVRQQMQHGGKPEKTDKKPEPVVVNTSVTADWNLTGDGPGQQLQFFHELKQKITNADLAGLKKAAEAKTAEEQEAAEEMEESEMPSYSSDGQPKPGEPVFIFVGQLSDEAKSKALSEAIVKVKKSAEVLAKAAGVTLGPVYTLSSQTTPQMQQTGYAQQYFYRNFNLGAFGQTSEVEDVVANELGPIKVNVSVSIAYQLK